MARPAGLRTRRAQPAGRPDLPPASGGDHGCHRGAGVPALRPEQPDQLVRGNRPAVPDLVRALGGGGGDQAA